MVALENLNTAGMTKRPAPEPDPDRPGQFLPNGAAAKAGLNKSILDAGWNQFANILTAKVEETGRRIVFVNPACTSIDCHLAPDAAARSRTRLSAPYTARSTRTLTGPETLQPGPDWALVRPMRPEKLAASAVRAVTDLLVTI